MPDFEIRALKQNTAAIVAQAAAGETITITERGRPVARMTAIPTSRHERLLDSGRARPPRQDVNDLPAPEPGVNLSAELAAVRHNDR